MTTQNPTTAAEPFDLLKLVEKIRVAICDQNVIIRLASANVDDPSTTYPLIKSADRYNDELFDLYEKLDEYAESVAAKGGA